MNVHISYRIPKHADVDREINHAVEKLTKRLQVFRPDLIHLRGSVEQNTPREGVAVSLNLRLPSGQIAAQETAASASSAIKAAFDQLLQQLSKHKDLLRKTHKWSRRGAGRAVAEPPVASEESSGIEKTPTVSAEDVHSFVNANLPRLQRFVERELSHREISGALRAGLLTPEEVIDEAIANALDEKVEKPDRLALEPWLYRLALRAIDELSSREQELSATVGLAAPLTQPAEAAADEARFQFHQPDESLTAENLIPDSSTPTPEEAAYTDEMIDILQVALDGAGLPEREAFILHAIEGFSVEEIASITERPPDQVRDLIAKARDHVRRSAPLANRFGDRLLQASK